MVGRAELEEAGEEACFLWLCLARLLSCCCSALPPVHQAVSCSTIWSKTSETMSKIQLFSEVLGHRDEGGRQPSAGTKSKTGKLMIFK